MLQFSGRQVTNPFGRLPVVRKLPDEDHTGISEED